MCCHYSITTNDKAAIRALSLRLQPAAVSDIGQADFQLLIDQRRFRIAVDAKPPAAVAAFSNAFGRIATDLIAWTVGAI